MEQMEHQLEQVNQQIKELVGIYRGAVSCTGCSENEFWIWYALVNMEGEFSQQDLCGMWSLSKQTVNTIVTQLSKKGYVTLEAVPGARNRKIIRPTPEGLIRGRELVTPIFQAEQRALNQLSKEEWNACTAVLRRYIGIFKEEVYGTQELSI